MENFFIEYRDPIFGLIVLISIILLIAVLSYFWGVFSKKDEKHNLEKFIKKFESSNGLSDEHKNMLQALDIGADSLSLLAMVFVKSGDFEKAIHVYLIALEKANNKKEREFILTNLGKVYFKAGFLQRSNDIFLEALKLGPRNEDALKHLTVIYEKLRSYKDELSVLDSLHEQGVDTKTSIAFVKAQIISNDRTLSFKEKIDGILEFKDYFPQSARMALELYVKNKEPLDEFKHFPPLSLCMDIIWQLKEAVNLQDNEYGALFYAKGFSDEYKKSEIFEINALSAMRMANFKGADLSFSYLCGECKSTIPLFFYRCPVCYALKSAHIISSITEENSEISMPF